VRPGVLAALLVAGLPLAGNAQTIEISPVAGFRFGGSACAVSAPCTNESGERFEVDDAASFGVQLGYRLGDGEIELVYARQNTRLQSATLFAGVPLFDIALESWQLGGNYFFGDDDARLRPFLGIGLGLTRMLPEPSGLSDETRFSASFGAGAKLWLGGHVGLRLEARGFFTVLDGDGGSFCGGDGCVVFVGSSQVISQVDLRAGLILRF
jgi:outer membrane protein W